MFIIYGLDIDFYYLIKYFISWKLKIKSTNTNIVEIIDSKEFKFENKEWVHIKIT
jgi:hypothetical protein